MQKQHSKLKLAADIRPTAQQYLLYFACSLLAFMPLAFLYFSKFSSWALLIIIPLNLLGWLLVVSLLVPRHGLKRAAQSAAQELGVESIKSSLEDLVESVLYELWRKDQSLSVDLVEKRIKTKQDLSQAFEQVVELAYQLLGAQSAELALFDSRLRMYHSSYLVGRPFKKSAQAMFSGALQGKEEEWPPDIMVQPIAFAGNVLGSIRVALTSERIPTQNDREILKVLAVQGGLAIVNGQYTQQLMRMQQVSDETQRAKTGFLANLSHEIRGPLGLMLNAVELVVDGLCGSVNEEQVEMLKAVRSNGEHLLELINDVLDYAKAESGKVTPRPEDLLVDEVLKDIVAVVRTQADAKGHKLEFKSNSEALAIACDRRHLRQMLINLLTNAIKYTPDGGKIEVWADRIAGQRIKINVRDSGVGIDTKDFKKVFSAFERVDHSYSRQQVGTGLGMSLTKKLAEVNGASIDFTSTLEKGSQFWLSFPAIKFDSASHVVSAPKDLDIKGNGSELLLFEADAHERIAMCRYLESLGFNVLVAENREHALEILGRHKVELVIIDGRIFDNPEVPDERQVQDFRIAAKSNFLPLVLLTSRAFSFDIEKFLRVGIDVCLIKPVPLKQLAQVCRELIDGDYIGLNAPPVSKPVRSELIQQDSIEESENQIDEI